ncbi:hypothetical protein CO676_20315 [Sinorhizobium sp. BJ1]|nr:hypothetical protein CO676_20315 [Sinorhizobium sp. BJ1]
MFAGLMSWWRRPSALHAAISQVDPQHCAFIHISTQAELARFRTEQAFCADNEADRRALARSSTYNDLAGSH